MKLNVLLILPLSTIAQLSGEVNQNASQGPLKKKDSAQYYQLSIEKPNRELWSQFWVDVRRGQPLIGNTSSVFKIHLPFLFPFFHQEIEDVYVSPQGLLSPTSNKTLWPSKHIAPLFARLDPFHDSTSALLWWADKRNTSVTVEWQNATVSDLPHKAPFTFRVRLWMSGLIEFTYDKLGVDLNHLNPLDRDFFMGISDSVALGGKVHTYSSLTVPRNKVKEGTVVSLDPGQHDSSSSQKQDLEAEKDQFSKSSRSQKKSQARKNIYGQKKQNRKSGLTENKDSSPIFSPSREEDNVQIHTPSNFAIPDHINLYGHYNSSASVVTSEKQDQYVPEERPSAVPETSVTVYYGLMVGLILVLAIFGGLLVSLRAADRKDSCSKFLPSSLPGYHLLLRHREPDDENLFPEEAPESAWI